MNIALTKAEESKAHEIDRVVNLITDLVYDYFNKGVKHESRIVNVKKSKKNSELDEWGYYVSHEIGLLAMILRKNKVRSFMDLGCGAGVLLRILTMYTDGLIVGGIDNEPTLVKYCNERMAYGAKEADLLTITRANVSRYEVLYFYEPLAGKEAAQKFVENLSKIVVKGQYIIYYPAGYIWDYLNKSTNIKQINKGKYQYRIPFKIFKVTETLNNK